MASSTAPVESRFFSVPRLKAAGIGVDDNEHLFYKRAAVSKLLQFVDDAIGRYGFIDGLPGTGKSTNLWYKLLCLVERGATCTVTWIHFDRWGIVTRHIKLHHGQAGLVIEDRKEIRQKELAEKIEQVDTGILVLDGVNKEIFRDCVAAARIWKGEDKQKTVFLTMSNKIERLHKHEELAFGEGKQMYCTQHSWTLDEFKRAFIDENGRRSRLFHENIEIFKQEWEIEEDDDLKELMRRTTRKRNREGRKKFASVLEVVCQKFCVCGGSARWMLQMTRPEIEDAISDYLGSAESVSSILSFDLGPTSSVAKTHMYYSAEYPGASGKSTTVYTIVSERATQLLVEKKGSDAVRMLYAQARTIQNPAFLGWVVEADYFTRCKHDTLILLKKGNRKPTKFECQTGAVVAFDCAHLKLLQSYDEASTMRDAVQHLIPTVAGEANAKIGKPLAWNQGGYDVVRIEMAIDADGDTVLHLRFGQVTKSRTHSLKLKYFYEFTKFLIVANHVIASIEIGFVVPAFELDKFKITHAQVTGSGLLDAFPVYAAADKMKWKQSKEQEQIVVYGLDIER